VRLTAQNILSRNRRIVDQPRRRWWHRATPPAIAAWPGIRLDLTGALLLEFSLTNCRLDYADFTHAQFIDRADFGGAQFTGGADFGRGTRSTRGGPFFPLFEVAQLTGEVYFTGARVVSTAEPNSKWPPDWTTRPAEPDNGEDPAFRYLTKVEDGNPSGT
jgi:uncharacterized protein YjbI with pentapeptide repeats